MIVRLVMTGALERPSRFASEIAERAAERHSIDLAAHHVRTFLAAHSRPSRDGNLRIRANAIKKLAKLYPGAPVMRNHGMFGSDDMPIGTVFDASSRTAQADAQELLLSFYFLKNDEEGDRIARKIDSGIWKESSIQASFNRALCSICGESMDPSDDNHCTQHEPGEEYAGETAMMEFDDPSEAPEFSLCWSGRLAGTRALSNEDQGTVSAQRFMEYRRSWMAVMHQEPASARRMAWMAAGG
jgi:hypothetical protein